MILSTTLSSQLIFVSTNFRPILVTNFRIDRFSATNFRSTNFRRPYKITDFNQKISRSKSNKSKY